MDFDLSPRQQAVRERVREFAGREIAPRAVAHDQSGDFPWQNFRQLGAGGYLGLTLPARYGGQELDWVSYAICVEEIARCCAATAVIYEVHSSLHCHALYRFGTEEQKDRFLPDLVAGRRLGAFALTEPHGGSDAAAIRTAAVRRGDHYILNGRKCMITSGGAADSYIVMAVTDRERGSRGITAFIVEKGTEGFSCGPPEKKMGIHASWTSDLVFEDCRVPVTNRLGEEGAGLRIALSCLDGGRIGIAAEAVGLAQAALDAAVTFDRERRQVDHGMETQEARQWMLADMVTDINAARLMTYRAAFLFGQGKPCTAEVAMAKLFASQMASRHTRNVVQMCGNYGYVRENVVERFMRDARVTEIYEGTSEIMRLVIARHLLR